MSPPSFHIETKRADRTRLLKNSFPIVSFIFLFFYFSSRCLTFEPILETIWFMNSNICPGVCSKGDVKAVLHCIRAESPAWHSKAVRSFSTSNSSPNFSSHLRTYSRPLIATHICEKRVPESLSSVDENRLINGRIIVKSFQTN